jgi:hypothetical protein
MFRKVQEWVDNTKHPDAERHRPRKCSLSQARLRLDFLAMKIKSYINHMELGRFEPWKELLLGLRALGSVLGSDPWIDGSLLILHRDKPGVP